MGFTTDETFFSAERDTASRSRHKKSASGISRDASKERRASSSAPSPSPSASTNQPGLGLLNGMGNSDAIHNPLAGFNSILANPALLAAAQQHASGRFNPFMFSWPSAGSTSGGSSFESFLSGFPVDPFLVPPAAVAPFVPPFGATSPSSLPPLTIRGSEDASPKTPTSGTNTGIFAIDPALALAPSVPVSASAPAPLTALASIGAAPPPAKRQKTSAAAAATTSTNPNTTTKKTTPTTESHSSMSPIDENKPQLASRQLTPLTAAEDKRRRNTAASARFRAKKKEREAAMEYRAKGLEDRVIELERECESLRKENGWLKGLVIGATSGDNVDFTGLEEMFNAFKAAAAADPSGVASASNEERIGSKRKRTTA
jgi:hypothetical protein